MSRQRMREVMHECVARAGLRDAYVELQQRYWQLHEDPRFVEPVRGLAAD